jgi:hypothetical protein
MTFTFAGDLTDPIDFVRFEIGDTTEDSAWLTDEMIDSLVETTGSNEAAVIKAIKYIIMQLSKPDFKADWLSVTNGEARKGYQAMLADKQTEYGIITNRITASAVFTYRSDSNMEDPN